MKILLSDKNKSLDQMSRGVFVRVQASRIVQIDDSNLYKWASEMRPSSEPHVQRSKRGVAMRNGQGASKMRPICHDVSFLLWVLGGIFDALLSFGFHTLGSIHSAHST